MKLTIDRSIHKTDTVTDISNDKHRHGLTLMIKHFDLVT